MNQDRLNYNRCLIQFHKNHPFPGGIIEMMTGLGVLCVKIMTHPQAFGPSILAAHSWCDQIWECNPPPPASESVYSFIRPYVLSVEFRNIHGH